MIPLKYKLKTIAVGIGVFIATYVILIILFQVFDFTGEIVNKFDHICYDRLLIPDQSPAKEIVIVDFDTTARAVNRRVCAAIIAGLKKASAKVIGFDILFIDRRISVDDNLFILVTDTSQKIVHAFNLMNEQSGGQAVESDIIPYALKRKGNPCPFTRHDICIKANGAELPFPTLTRASKNMAHINFQYDADGNIRRLPLILGFGNYIYKSLSLEMVRLYWGIEDDSLELQFETRISDKNVSNHYILLHKNNTILREIPVDQFGQIIIQFADRHNFINYTISQTKELLKKYENGSNFNPFKEKLVLIVNSRSPGDASRFSVLGNEILPNWIIHASVISQILNENFIIESPLSTLRYAAIFTFLSLLWLVFLEIHFPILWRRTALVVSCIIVLLIFEIFSLLYLGMWIGVILPMILICSTYLSAKYFFKKYKHPLPPQYLDFEIHIQEKVRPKYLVDVINSPTGEAFEDEFKLHLEEFEDIIHDLQTLNAPRPEVRNFGKKIFNDVFQPQARRRYDESLGLIKQSPDKRLRLKLRIESPELSVIPWEYFYDPEQNEHLVLQKNISLVRYLLLPKVIEPLEVEPPLKILVIVAMPSDCQALNVDKEKTKIDRALRKMRWKHQVKVDVINHATLEKIRNRIHKYHIIHYIGHGGFITKQKEDIGCLILENDSGLSHLVDAEQLSLLLSQTKVRLVILNACETAKTSTYNAFLGAAPALVSAGIPAVIAMQFPMPDVSAIVFSEEFYRSLTRHYQVESALTDARIALAGRIGVDRIDWGIPVLFMRSPDGVLFRQKPL